MNITLSPERMASLEAEADRRNSLEGASPTTAEEIATGLLNAAADSYAETAEEAVRAMLAANDMLMEIGKEVAAAPPEKQAAAIAAAREALNA